MHPSLLPEWQEQNELIKDLMPAGWQICMAPKTLKEMKGRHLLLLKDSPITYGSHRSEQPPLASPITAGCVVEIYDTTNKNQHSNSSFRVPEGIDLGPRERLLLCHWSCDRCKHVHAELLPNIWLELGHMVFVTPI